MYQRGHLVLGHLGLGNLGLGNWSNCAALSAQWLRIVDLFSVCQPTHAQSVLANSALKRKERRLFSESSYTSSYSNSVHKVTLLSSIVT